MANIIFNKVVWKVIKNVVKHARLVLLASVEAFIVTFVIFNDKLLSYINICCTTRRC
jgi:hypothetical protein